METNLGELVLQGMINGFTIASHAGWQMMLDNPWMFTLITGALLVGWVNRRLSRRRPSFFDRFVVGRAAHGRYGLVAGKAERWQS